MALMNYASYDLTLIQRSVSRPRKRIPEIIDLDIEGIEKTLDEDILSNRDRRHWENKLYLARRAKKNYANYNPGKGWDFST